MILKFNDIDILPNFDLPILLLPNRKGQVKKKEEPQLAQKQGQHVHMMGDGATVRDGFVDSERDGGRREVKVEGRFAGLCQSDCVSVVGSGKQRASQIGYGAVEGSLVRALSLRRLAWWTRPVWVNLHVMLSISGLLS